MLYGNQEQQDMPLQMAAALLMSLQVAFLHQYVPADGSSLSYVPADGISPPHVPPCRWYFFINMSLQMVAALRPCRRRPSSPLAQSS